MVSTYLHLIFPPSSSLIIKPQGHLLPGKEMPQDVNEDEHHDLYLTDKEIEVEDSEVSKEVGDDIEDVTGETSESVSDPNPGHPNQ